MGADGHRFARGVPVLGALLLLLMAVGAAPAAANVAAPGGSWYWQAPTPQGDQIDAMTFVDGNTGWAVGSPGLILKTGDGGATWRPEALPNGASVRLDAVTFGSATTGWACGQDANTGDAALYATTNGGGTWAPQTLPLAAGNGLALTSVCALDALNAYAVGDAGVILHTTNGGTSWAQQAAPLADDLDSVTFKSVNNGWVVGAGGDVFRTENGGLTWFPQASGTGATLHRVVFSNLYDGYAVGDGGTVCVTVDGGWYWNQEGPGNNDLYDVAVAAGGVYAAGANGEIDRSTDGGLTWTSIGPGGRDIDALCVLGSNDLRVAGQNGVFMRTVDGATFTPMWWATTSNTLNGISFADALNGWAVGGTGTIVHTGSGGANWYTQRSGVAVPLHGVDFVSASDGWAVGNRPGGGTTAGTILATTDGGLDWNAQTSAVTRNLYAVDFTDIADGWAVGDAGVIDHTANGGALWANQNPTNALGLTNLRGVSFASVNDGVVVGMTGELDYTINGGTTWTPGTDPTGGADYAAVQMVDQLHGWAVGAGGTIVVTTDGGANWTQQTSNTGADLHGVRFTDLNDGWVVGAGGTVVTTTNGGTTWSPQAAPTDDDLLAAASVDAAHVWTCGGNGDILSSFNPNTMGVTNLKGQPGNGQLTLSWVDPASNFGGVMVYFSTVRCACDAGDTYGQAIAYEGTGSTLVRTGLQNDTAYYFTLFVRDAAGDWSNPQTLVLVPIPTFKVTLNVKPATQVFGKTIRFSGTVTPGASATGASVLIQRFTGSWKTFATAKVGAAGSFAASAKLGRGTFKVRAYIAGTSKALAGYSAVRYVTWR